VVPGTVGAGVPGDEGMRNGEEHPVLRRVLSWFSGAYTGNLSDISSSGTEGIRTGTMDLKELTGSQRYIAFP